MKRKYNTQKIKSNWSYSVEELSELLDVQPRTVYSWIKEGLPTIDEQRPYLMYGPTTRQWLDKKQNARKWPREYGKLPCFTCKGQRRIKFGTFKITHNNTQKIRIQGQCVSCNRPISRGDVKANEAHLIKEYGRIPKMINTQ